MAAKQGEVTDAPTTKLPTGNALLDVGQAAVMLGLCHRTLDNWRVRGEGPPFLKIGRAVRYSPNDLDGWLAGCRFQNTGAAKEGK